MKNTYTLFALIFLLVQISFAQKLKLTSRKAAALTGTAFANSISDSTLSLAEREKIIYQEIKNGNVPDFLRKLSLVEYELSIEGIKYKVSYFSLPDYMAIGGNDDYFYIPMTPILAQRVANLLKCSLPTKKIVDLIDEQAKIKLAPNPIPPTKAMTTVPVFITHNLMIRQQLVPYITRHNQSELTSGNKKDIIVSNKIYTEKTPKVVIYGWHQLNGKAIQPVYNKHSNTWADYSHGVRLIQNKIIINNKKTTLQKVLADRKLCVLLSDEGVIEKAFYP
ncbi:hypothetical protein WG904_15670 [Pedobacter sp. Du54]|uniref:hypothetical protein n=1 Tax=Pedobacter anseongensis TaxID=3133439 RepID=UPI0030AA0AD7